MLGQVSTVDKPISWLASCHMAVSGDADDDRVRSKLAQETKLI